MSLSDSKVNKTNIISDNSSNKSPINEAYRTDYIPIKKNYIYMENNSQNFLGHKLNRNPQINNNKIIIPNEKRYHMSLLETSLEKIRNEIRQKRFENSNRMKELNEKESNLNDYFKNKDFKGKYIGNFNNKVEIKNSNNSLNSNADKNLIELKETDTYNNKKATNINTIINSKNNRIFDKELIFFDINESFSINPNKRKKLDSQNNFIVQKQNEFVFNNNRLNFNDNIKNNKKLNISFGNDDNKLLLLNTKESINSNPISNNLSFGLNQTKNNNKTKEEENKKSLFEENKEKIKSENKNINENKILFGAPKENISIAPLSNNFSFGFKKDEKNENIQIINNTNKQKVVFGAPKTNIVIKPLSDKVSFGIDNKNKNSKIFGVPKDSNSSPYQPLSNNFSFGLKKEDEKESKNENKNLFKANPFSNDNKSSENNNESNKNDNNKKIKSLFEKNNSINKILEKQEKKEIFEESNKKKKTEEGNNENRSNNLFGENKLSNNLFINTEKETKVVSINAVNTSGSIFGNNSSNQISFGFPIDQKDNNSIKENIDVKENKDIFGGRNNLFGKTLEKIDNDKKESNNIKLGLFGNTKENESNKNIKLFSSEINYDSSNNNQNKNGGLFGEIGIFSTKGKNDNAISLFGNNSLIENNNENKTSLFGNNTDNKTSLFGNNTDNKTSLFGNNTDNKITLFENNTDNKTSLFGINNNNKTSLFGNNNDNKSLFGINNDNKTSLFGNNIDNKTSLFGNNNDNNSLFGNSNL